MPNPVLSYTFATINFDRGGEHGFVYDNGTFTPLNVPGAASTIAEAINDCSEVAGDYIDASGNTHGFVYDDATYTTLTAPGATNTYAYGINDRGEIAGTYYDSSGEHGFLASPERGEATAGGFGELLTAHVRLGGMRDYLPDVPGINGRSPHSAHASGMMDQTPATGACFASFSGAAGGHAATQVLLHASGTSLGKRPVSQHLCSSIAWGSRAAI
jgi:uncharacterized membrane protein